MTKIAWTEKTWQTVAGCTKVSDGCDNCYAERMAGRLANMGLVKYIPVVTNRWKNVRWAISGTVWNGEWNGKICCDESALDIPLHWKKPRKIFVNSMSDTFHEKVPFEFIDKMFAVMALCPQHTFQCLSKRPERMLEYFITERMVNWEDGTSSIINDKLFPLPNVHLGTTCENQAMADLRIPYLLQTPAAVRFISAEPLLGDIDFENVTVELPSGAYVKGTVLGSDGRHFSPGGASGIGIDQVIIGAESIGGHPGRECNISWVRNIVNQCKAAGVKVFVKQIHMWRVEGRCGRFGMFEKNGVSCQLYYENYGVGKKPKRVLLKYPRDKGLFPADLRCWEYPK